MKLSFSVPSIITKLLERLANIIQRYQEEKKIKGQLFDALNNEIEDFNNIFEKIINLGKVRLMPLLETKESSLNISQINEVAKCLAELCILYANLWESFIRMVNGCYEVKQNTAFMEHLHKTSDLLHDFVINMGNMRISSDRIKIGSGFPSFRNAVSR